MKAGELTRYDGLGLADLVRRREVSAAELLDASIARVEAVNPEINAVVTRLYDQARAAIAAGLPAGPFTGVPYLLKDLGAHYAGAVTSYGSALFKDFVVDHDSEITARLKRAGLVIFGKTNTPEMGLASSTEPRLFGPTRNPWSLAHSAGRVERRLRARRWRRAWRRWRMPQTGAAPFASPPRRAGSSASSRRARATRWARTPARAGAAPRWGTPSPARCGTAPRCSMRRPGPTWGSLLGAAAVAAVSRRGRARPWPPAGSPSRRSRGTGSRLIAECAEAARAAARLCERLGHHVEEAGPDIDARALGEATLVVIGGNVRAALEARAAALGRELGPADVERITWMRAADGRTTTAADYARSIGVMHRAGRVVARFFTGYDVLLSPTMCRPPHPLGVIDMMTDDVERYTKAVLGTIGFTSLFNSSGSPAMSVPLAWSQAGLPLGVQFAATYGGEATLLRLGAQLEAAQPWAGRRPPGMSG